MLYSKSVEYAIQALGSLAELGDGEYRMARRIAEDENMPSFFLAKTLQTLARQGMLRSSKGPTGGFGLETPAKKIRLIDVIEALDGLEDLESGANGLPGFRPVHASIVSYLKKTTIADVAEQRRREKRRAAGAKKAAKKKAPARKKAAKKKARRR